MPSCFKIVSSLILSLSLATFAATAPAQQQAAKDTSSSSTLPNNPGNADEKTRSAKPKEKPAVKAKKASKAEGDVRKRGCESFTCD